MVTDILLFWNFAIQTSFVLPLLILLFTTLLWTLANPRVFLPTMAPTTMILETPTDTVSTLYRALVFGRLAIPVEFAYQRFVAAVRNRYGLSPWEIPWRKGKAQKLGIEHARELRRLNAELLRSYEKSFAIDQRSPTSFFGEAPWQRRAEIEGERFKKALIGIERELPELWSS